MWPSRLARSALILGVALCVWAGWRLFWFHTDDAFIAFRYVRNLVDGHGPVWNRAPFLPVEGYSSPLWVALLALVWKLTGVAPPDAANVIGLWCGYGTLGFLYAIARRMTLPAPLQPRRAWLVAIAALGVLANRTFYTWLSSGLETPLFNLCVTACVYYGLWPTDRRDLGWARALSGWSVACALTRPDGLLFALAAAAQIGLAFRLRPVREWVLHASAFVVLIAHLVWRRSYYGDWLPNTYYAKQVAAWPEAGLRYLGCFLIENGLWLWLLFLIPWAGMRAAEALRTRHIEPGRLLTLAAVVGHIGYFTLIVGGDHFEYRVYSAWLPLAFLSSVHILGSLTPQPRIVAAACALIVLLSLPIPWVHWAQTHRLEERRTTFRLSAQIAYDFPAPFSELVWLWQDWQNWLLPHGVGRRHQEHKVFVQHIRSCLLPPDKRPPLSWKERTIAAESFVGVIGWELPEVGIIDRFGLNDAVIARSTTRSLDDRRMAHDRVAPAGYVECFQPNLEIDRDLMQVTPRTLSDDQIRGCEREYAQTRRAR